VSNHEDGFTGQGRVFEEAVEDAWKKAQIAGNAPGWFKVLQVSVFCENPVKEYLVKIEPGA